MGLLKARCLSAVLLVLWLSATGSAQSNNQNQKTRKRKNSDVENIGTRDINKGTINFVSLDREIALGRDLAQQVEQESRLVKDLSITEYVNRVGQNIVRNSDAKVPFTIKVIESDEINAFALPGGFFYVNSGLILAADDEAELAGVMAHEIAHVAARHGTEQESKGQLVNLASLPLIFVAGPVGYGLQQAANLLVPLGFLKFSRSAEEEADFLGVQYLYKTGYDPSAMVRFFEKLQAKEKMKPGSMSRLFATHPPTGDRIKRVEETIADVLPPREEYVETTSEFDHVKAYMEKTQNNSHFLEDLSRPSLHRKLPPPSPDRGGDQDDPTTEPDDRPTLKRGPQN